MARDYCEDYRTLLILRVVPIPSLTLNPYPNPNPSLTLTLTGTACNRGELAPLILF